VRWDAFPLPLRRTKYRYADGEEELTDYQHPAAVQTTCIPDETGLSPLIFFLTPDQADQLAGKLAAAAAAARAMPDEVRICQIDRTKDELSKAVLP